MQTRTIWCTRTIHDLDDDDEVDYNEGLDITHHSVFPEAHARIIQQRKCS